MKEIIEIGKRVLEEEKRALENLIKGLDKSFKEAVEVIANSKGKVIVTGMGKSGLIGKKISATLSSTGTPSVFLHPAEAIHGDLGVISKEDIILAISNSGETEELLAIIPTIKRWGNFIISITNNPKSTLAKLSDIHLNLNIDKEACLLNLAPTSSSTATLALGDALAVAVYTVKGFTAEDFAKYHPGGSLGKKLMKVREIMHTGEKIPIVKPDTPMKEAVIEMSQKGFGATLVTDEEGKLIGIITDGDLRRYINRGGSIDNSVAEDVMTRNPKYTTEDQYLLEALELMERHNITTLPVLKDGKPIGIIHLHDILKSGVI
jgi:arabinose-5-phosphate isomerase